MPATFKLTPNQKLYVQSLQNPVHSIVIVTGPAGTGKTKLAVEHGLHSVLAPKDHISNPACRLSRLVLTRPLVQVSGEDMGFLPGNMTTKLLPWVSPVLDAIMDSAYRDSATRYLEMGSSHDPTIPSSSIRSHPLVEVRSLGLMRGMTFDESYVVCEEAQNCSKQQLVMLMTRLGKRSKLVFTADLDQCDLDLEKKQHQQGCALSEFLRQLEVTDDEVVKQQISHIRLDTSDIRRHSLIPHILKLF